LAARKPNLAAMDENGNTALHLAAAAGHWWGSFCRGFMVMRLGFRGIWHSHSSSAGRRPRSQEVFRGERAWSTVDTQQTLIWPACDSN
jgi:hypothetical protein